MIRSAVLCFALVLAAPAGAEPTRAWTSHISEASVRFGIPVEWIRQVMQAESGGQTHRRGRPIRSRAGAMGLMQLMPGTWQTMRSEHRLGANPDEPRDNILAGAAYLRAMYDRFGYPGLFAAYNAGPARYAAYLNHGKRLPRETVDYVAKVAGRDAGRPRYQRPVRSVEAKRGAGVLVALSRADRAIGMEQPEQALPELFFRLGGHSRR